MPDIVGYSGDPSDQAKRAVCSRLLRAWAGDPLDVAQRLIVRERELDVGGHGVPPVDEVDGLVLLRLQWASD